SLSRHLREGGLPNGDGGHHSRRASRARACGLNSRTQTFQAIVSAVADRQTEGNWSEAFDRCEPGLGAVIVDRDREHRGLYRPDRPTVHEGSAQLGLRHPARAPVPGLAVAETHQVVHPPWPKGRPQAVDINRALLVVEDMEYTTIGDDVDLPPQAVEVEHIP